MKVASNDNEIQPQAELIGPALSGKLKHDIAGEAIAGVTSTDELKRRSVRGGAASLVSQGFAFAAQMGSTVILARLLSPEDYGIQSMVLTMTGFFTQFRDGGLSTATVQQKVLTNEQISTLFWLNVALGSGLALLVAALAPAMVLFYRDSRLLHVTLASSLLFFLNGLAVQHKALLDRSMRFVTVAKIDILQLSVGVAVGIGMALRGYGYWALLGQALASSATSTIASWVAMPWRPGKPARGAGVRSMVRLGSTVTLNSFVVYLGYNAEKILLGRFWGVEAIGIYGRAYALANLPVQQFIGSIGSVAFPMLSRLQNDPERLKRSFLKCHSVVLALIIPAVLGCSLFADELVTTVLGPKWNGIPPILRLLAPTVLVFALINPFSWLLRATGRVERSLNIAFLICPVVVIGIVSGLKYGPPGVALGYSTAMIILLVPVVAWAKSGTDVTAKDYWDMIKRPSISGLFGGAAGWLFSLAVGHTCAPLPFLISALAVSFGTYLIMLFWVMGQGPVYQDLFRSIFQRKSASPQDAI